MTHRSRSLTITHEIPQEVTGLRGKCFVHMDHMDGKILGIRLSEKGKDDSTLDRLFHVLGDILTTLARQVQQ